MPTKAFRFPPYDAALEAELCRAPRDRIRQLQSERLVAAVRYSAERIPFYQRLWSEAGISVDEIRSIDDLARLPTWNVDDQRRSTEAAPPFGSHFAPLGPADIAYVLSTSGTTGTPRIVPVTFDDLPGLQDVMARCLRFVGLTAEDLLQVTFTYAPLGAAWACTWAAHGAGIGVVPASSGRTTSSERQIDLIRRAGVTALIGTPSFMLHLAETARSLDVDPAQLTVRRIITAGEISSPGTRAALERAWNAAVYDLYGTVDTLTWSSIDCEASRLEHGGLGMHIWEDACTIEVLDERQQPVAPGEYGEMTVTSWAWRSSPRIRFRTGDSVAVRLEPCPCGRTLARMMPVTGRVDDMIRIRAQSIWPMAIETALQSVEPAIADWLVECAETDRGDWLSVVVEWTDPGATALRDRLEVQLSRRLNVSALSVSLVPPGSTASRTGAGRDPKVRRVFDLRRHDGAAPTPTNQRGR